ncbi:MAG TPA: response regulator [Sulfuricurvum sp.]|nr:MAG: response regulator [Campylobacterales bacterium 16-40-21]OZA01744.1 MAG: response regulator [Sulfuricurvum sp. 17-40-25]HQS67949.1 response regulator [Sulfuricurvum sp.]HQT37686.1 response regulator [Sulfuricurvum sp.]
MKILVVDDSKLARLTLIKTLKEHEPSADIIEAENGDIAVELYKAKSPCVVFLDLTMPVMDGYEALKLIMEINPRAQVVVVSADIQMQAQALVLALGAKLMVPKPINSDKMLAVLQQLVF